MESPIKMKLLASEANKENLNAAYESDEIAVPIKGIPTLADEPKKEEPTTAPTIKEDEAVEPILQENPQRFVLFPIKYHEVSRFCPRLDMDALSVCIMSIPLICVA